MAGELISLDTALYTENPYIELILFLHIEAENIRQWLAAHKLALNTGKTNYIVIANRQKVRDLQIVELKIDNDIGVQICRHDH